MKIASLALGTLLTVLFTGFAAHAGFAPAPEGPRQKFTPLEVRCQNMAMLVDENGIPRKGMEYENFIASTEPKVVSLKGFEFKTVLRQVCASNGIYCFGVYTLQIETSYENISTSSSAVVKAKDPAQEPKIASMTPVRTNLKVGDKEATINCTIIGQ